MTMQTVRLMQVAADELVLCVGFYHRRIIGLFGLALALIAAILWM